MCYKKYKKKNTHRSNHCIFRCNPQHPYRTERLMSRPLLIAIIWACTCLNGCMWTETEDSPDFLPLDDSEYPYAGIPRLVIETANFAQVRDKETKIPAKMQIYGKTGPESDVIDLTIKGRGNSSIGMSKYSMKIKFPEKREMFGMPADKEWALISNHADKTLLRNYMTFNLARNLQMNFVPKCAFVEVYLNRDYMGVYLLTETIKVSSARLNIPQDGKNYLVEVDAYHDNKDTVIHTANKLPLKIHFPKTCDDSCQQPLKSFMDQWEKFIQKKFQYDSLAMHWIDTQDYSAYYWVEEFSKNTDSNLKTSVFFTWERNGKMKMGPVWDFDLSYGEYKNYSPENWYSRSNAWNRHLFKNGQFKQEVSTYWKEHRTTFLGMADSLDYYEKFISKAAKNNFKRWPVLETTFLWEFNQSYDTHAEAVDSLKSWMTQRIRWIDGAQ